MIKAIRISQAYVFTLVKTCAHFRMLDLLCFSQNESVRVATTGAYVFRCVASVAHLFYMPIGENMDKNIQKKVIDITGIELTPGEPTVCLGNGEQGFECCCDECDYYLLCFTDFNPKNKERNIAENKVYIE